MSPSKTPPFRLRDKLHEPEGNFTKRDILKAIHEGRYSGEEEISTAPYLRWQKLSSHPQFYDAFLKKLYGEYHSPDPETPSAAADAAQSPKEGATRQAEAGRTRIADEVSEAEQRDVATRLGGEKHEGFGGTLHQSDIDKLFSAGPGVAPPPPDEAPRDPMEVPVDSPRGTGLVPIQGGMQETLPAPIDLLQRLDIQDSVREEESPEFVARQKTRERRRKLYGSVALILMLLMLFKLGQTETPEVPLVEDDAATIGRQLITDTVSPEERKKTLLEEAEALYLHDTYLAYRGANDVFREALAYDETNPAILARVAESAARMLGQAKDSAAAVKEIEDWIARGRATDPQFSSFYRVEALVALHQKKQEAGRALLGSAAEADPTNTENFLVLGEIAYALNELAMARRSFDESIKQSATHTRAHYMLSRVAADQRDLATAKAQAVEALKLNPLHPPSYLVLADVAVGQGLVKEARGLYETCGHLAKFSPRGVAGQAYYRLGLLQEAAGDKAAGNSFLLAYHYAPAVDDALAGKLKGLDKSEKNLKRLADAAEFGKEYFQEQGEGLYRQGKLNESLRFFQAARLIDPQDGQALLRLGEIAEKTAGSYDDFRRVMNLYQRAIEKNPSLTNAYIRLGLLETDQYNLDRGYKLLTQAAALAPNDAAPLVGLGKHYYKRQDYNESLEYFLKAAKRDPSDSEILYYAGMLRLVVKKDALKDAIRFFQQAYILDPKNYDALVELVKLKVLTFEKTFALKFVKNLIDAEPDNANLYWAMGEVYATNNETRRAISFYHKSLDIDNRNSKVRMALGRALESLGELDKAVAEYRLASLLDRRNSDGFFRAADLLFQQRKYNEAEEVLKFLANVTPNYPGAHRYLSKIYQLRRQKDLAIAEFEKEVSNNPQNAKFKLQLAELYMDYEKFDAAIVVLTEVANLPPIAKAPEYGQDKIAGYLLMSRCYRAMQKNESAEGAIRLALDIAPDDPQLHRELGYVYYGQQRDKEGVRAFEYYLSRNPAAQDAESIKGLIKQMMIEE